MDENGTGYSVADICPGSNDWDNHGQVVRCVAQTSKDFVEAPLISGEDKIALMSLAAQSSCGIKQ